MKNAIVAAASGLILSVALIGSASAYNHEYCSNYAQRAVGQYYEAQQRGLSNLNWPRWGNHRQAHYDWCMTFPGHATSEMNARQQRLNNGT